MKKAGMMLLRVLGVVLFAAAWMKFHELYTTPSAEDGFWTHRPYQIIMFAGELALGCFLISRIIPRACWLAATACFAFFSGLTLWRALDGQASCGCFGTVHVNPWITLWAIDIPATVLLLILSPKPLWVFNPIYWLTPWPHWRRIVATAMVIGAIVIPPTVILAMREVPVETENYIRMEPERWIDTDLPISDYIDISPAINQGDWVVFFYHHDCPDCQAALPEYRAFAEQFVGNEDFLRFAFIAIPPVFAEQVPASDAYRIGCLSDEKTWYVQTPVVVMVSDGVVSHAWEGIAPDPHELLELSLGAELDAAADDAQ